MPQLLGEGYVQISADLTQLRQQLSQATTAVSTAVQSMSTGALQMGQSFLTATTNMSNGLKNTIFHMQGAEKASMKLFRIARMGALLTATAMIAASKQGQHFMDALGQLNQAVIDRTIGPSIDRIASGLERLANNISKFGFAEGFEKSFSPTTRVTIVAIAGAITGALIPAIMSLNYSALVPLIQTLWEMYAPLLPWIIAGAAIAAIAYLIWDNWDTVVGWLSAAWDWLVGVITSGIQWIIDFFKEWGQTILLFMGPIGWLVAFLIEHWDLVVKATKAVWNAVVDFIKWAWNWIVTNVGPYVKPVIDLYIKAWKMVFDMTMQVWNKIVSFLTGIWDDISSGASDLWDGITSAISSFVRGAIRVMSPFLRFVNKVIEAVNWATGAKIPTIPLGGGGGTQSSSTPTNGRARAMAKGGVVTAPTFAMVGEGAYSEAVLPLSDKTFQSLAEGIMDKMRPSGGSTVQVQQMIVRKESDIDLIAQKLHRLQQQKARAGGVLTYGSTI